MISRPLDNRIFGDNVMITGETAEWLTRRNVLRLVAKAEGDRVPPVVVDDLRQVMLLAVTRGRGGIGSEAGTRSAPRSEPDPRSLLTTRVVADQIGVTPRAIIRAIAEGRLPAIKQNERWFITSEDANRYGGNHAQSQ